MFSLAGTSVRVCSACRSSSPVSCWCSWPDGDAAPHGRRPGDVPPRARIRALHQDGRKDPQQAFAERANIFTSYLPYAIVFKCVDKWARAFKDIDLQRRDGRLVCRLGARFDAGSFSSSLGSFSSPVLERSRRRPVGRAAAAAADLGGRRRRWWRVDGGMADGGRKS